MGSSGCAFPGAQSRRARLNWFATAVCVAAPLLGAATLHAAEPIATRLSALKYETTRAPDGATREALVPFTTIVPGESIRYAVDFTNTGAAPAANLVVELPLPGEMTLVAGSAEQGDTAVTYSIDGGATFGALAGLTVHDADGRPRVAQWSDVTTIRWTVLTALAPGAGGTVACRVVLK